MLVDDLPHYLIRCHELDGTKVGDWDGSQSTSVVFESSHAKYLLIFGISFTKLFTELSEPNQLEQPLSSKVSHRKENKPKS